MDEIKITRIELYNLIWSTPLITLAKKYNHSDNGIRKICKKHNIPLPKVGHWSKIQHGKKVDRIPLPKSNERGKVVIINPREGSSNTHVNSLMARRRSEIEADKTLPLIVSSRLSLPHYLVREVERNLKNQKRSRSHFSGIYTTDSGYLDLRVSKVNISRVLRLVDAVIKLLHARRHDVIVEGDSTYVVIGDQKIAISFREKLESFEINDRWNTRDYRPSGLLKFVFDKSYRSSEWVENKVKFEDKLSSLLAKLEILAEKKKEEEIRIKKWHEEYERQRMEERLAKELHDKELSDLKRLYFDAMRWQQSQFISSYLDQMEESIKEYSGYNPKLLKKIKWGRKKVKWFNPMIEHEDEILGDPETEIKGILESNLQ